MASTTLLLTIALLGMASIPLASASWDDCKTTKMILKNSWIHSNIDVISYSRLASGLSVTDCMRKCRSNQECYSFNYNKLTKWCYLGTTEETNLRQTRNGKWAAGYRRCVEQINNNPWTNEEFSGGASGTPPTPVVTLTVATSTITLNSLTVTIVAPTTFGTKADGTAETLGSYKVTCTPATSEYSIVTKSFTLLTPEFSGLAAGVDYTCSAVVVNSEGLQSTAVTSTPAVPASSTVTG